MPSHALTSDPRQKRCHWLPLVCQVWTTVRPPIICAGYYENNVDRKDGNDGGKAEENNDNMHDEDGFIDDQNNNKINNNQTYCTIIG